MSSTVTRWASSIAFGLVIGWAAYAVLNPLLLIVFGLNQPSSAPYVASDPATLERMQITAGLLFLATAVAVALALANISNMQRRIGWGFLLLGIALLLTLPASLLPMDISAHSASTAGAQAANDANTALFFVLLIFGLPYLGGGLLLTILGAVLIRKARNKPAIP